MTAAPDTAPLRSATLAEIMAHSLPHTDRPQLRTPCETIALALHAGMISVGFRLVGLGEDTTAPESSSEKVQALPREWNEHPVYAFRYKHAQSSMEFLIKVTQLGPKADVLCMALGDDRIHRFDLVFRDYINESKLPLTYGNNTSPKVAAELITNVFLSEGTLGDLGALLKVQVLQKLASGIHDESQQQQHDQRQQRAADREASERERRGQPHNPALPGAPTEPEPARPYPHVDPLQAPRSNRPLPEPIPGFEDEYEINSGPRQNRFPPQNAPGLGHNDLYPAGLGPHDPMRPHLGGPFAPTPGGFGGGGMHPTFDDPLFQGQGGQGGGYDPRAPPGARYDPVGPNDPLRDNRGGPGQFPGRGPQFPRGGFPGGGFGSGGGATNPFGGDFI